MFHPSASINFLSGGLSEEAASIYLNEMNLIGGTPWNVSFSYGRELTTFLFKGWLGSNEEAGQSYNCKTKANSKQQWDYKKGLQPSSDEQLFVGGIPINLLRYANK